MKLKTSMKIKMMKSTILLKTCLEKHMKKQVMKMNTLMRMFSMMKLPKKMKLLLPLKKQLDKPKENRGVCC